MEYKPADFSKGIPIWLAEGLMFGKLMKWWMGKRLRML
tara:strand:+ start:210 stop:323 length:114 start_codon:yes stop_codon:yes gene_type:complete